MNDIKQAKSMLALPFQHEPPGAGDVTVAGVPGKVLQEGTNTNPAGDAYRRDDAAAEAVFTTPTINTTTTTTTTTSHDKDDDDADEKSTQIDTVTLKCDLNDYLINFITVRCSLAQSKLETAEAQATTTTDKCPAERYTIALEDGAATNPDSHVKVSADIQTSLACSSSSSASSSSSSYIPFDELVRYTELEREWTRKARANGFGVGILAFGVMRNLRLCGGGEDSINNGTSAWGTPPGPASNGALSAWGVLPNQSLPPPAWGNVGGNNNNNNGSNSSSGSGNNPVVNSSSNGTGSNGNNTNNGNGNGNNSTGNGGGGGGGSRGGSSDPNFNKTNAQSQQQGTVPVATPPNAWNTAASNNRGVGQHQANVVNNNGNHHHQQQQQQQHHQHHHNQNHSHHQQQQQQQPAPAGQNMANNGANGNNGAGNGTAKNQLEVLNTMREALFAQDGWGCQHVNQDTNWEVPGSPEPPGASAASTGAGGGAVAAGGGASGGANKGDGGGPNGGSGGWKPQIMNNGTELWETNLRNGSVAPNQQQAQQAKASAVPWVPANNLGGTWMEDDDNGGGGGGGGPSAGSDGAANVWNGSAAAIVAGTAPMPAPVSGSGWATPAVNNASAGVAMWPPGSPQNPVPMNNPQVAVKKDEWGSIGGGGPQQQQQPGPPGGIIGVPPGSGGPAGGPGANAAAGMMAQGWGGDGRTGGVANPGGIGGLNLASSIGQANALIGSGELRGDPRGISGRLNGVGAVGGGMGWGTAPDHIGGKVPQVGGGMLSSGAVSSGPAGGPPVVQPWCAGNAQNNNGSKMPSSVGGGWDDIGRPMPALDETTAGGMLWGQGNAAAAGGVLARQNSSGWKDVGPDQMMRGGVHLQRNQSQAPLQGGGAFGPGIPGANSAGSGVRFGGGGGGGALGLGKPDAMSWGQGNAALARNGSWEDGVSGWGDEKPNMSWNVELAQNGTGGGWNKTPTTPKSGGSVGWPDPNDLSSTGGGAGGMDWALGGAGKLAGASGKQLNSGNPLEFIRASKEFRLLCEMGYKKEDVELSLRATGMIFDDAMEVLRQGAGGGGGGGGWRRPLSDEHGALGMGYDGPYSGRIPPLNHAASGLSFSQNNQNMLSNIPGGPGGGLGLDSAGGPVNLVALNNLKFLSQQQQQQQGTGGTGGHPPFNQASLLPPGGRGPNQQSQQVHQQQLAAAAAQPSNQQLRMLVQQIQLAVQNGYLNHQILNQPLAPQTLILLNQLLNHIKQIQLTQSNLARSGATGGISAVQLTLAINKHKTQIAQLQQQIAAQQSIYLKQQQQQGAGSGVPGHQGPPPLMPSNPALGMDFLRQQQQQQQQQDLMALQGTFAEMTLTKDQIMAASTGGVVFPQPIVQPQHIPGAAHLGAGSVAPGNVVVSGGNTSQQSRLNQWKLPSLEKDPSAGKDDLTDFSRAPGPTATGAAKSSTTSANLSSLGLVQDGTWATGRTNLTDGWPEQTGETESKDWSTTNNNNNTSSQDSSAFTDLVPEFEPGKPWKGTQLKIEDDPSITPGSVARSPLSISTAKESELFGGGGMVAPEKVSPTVAAGDGRSGGLNLTTNAWSFNTPSSTVVASGGKTWTDSTAGGGVAVTSAAADVWCTPIGKPSATRGPPPGLGGAASKGGNGGGGASWSTGSQRGSSWGVGTSWLLLKNLTSQIDASTLRTLCMQHGPIVSFHSYPTHGLALCRYNTREEATTAQQALNNCPLGTGTISAECPGSESEVQTYLQQLGGNSGSGVGGGGGANTVAVSSSTAGSISSISSQSWRQRGSTGAGADTWGSGWPLGGGAGVSAGGGSGAANLWAPLDTADPGTPSSLNSFLPESLLGPELN